MQVEIETEVLDQDLSFPILLEKGGMNVVLEENNVTSTLCSICTAYIFALIFTLCFVISAVIGVWLYKLKTKKEHATKVPEPSISWGLVIPFGFVLPMILLACAIVSFVCVYKNSDRAKKNAYNDGEIEMVC